MPGEIFKLISVHINYRMTSFNENLVMTRLLKLAMKSWYTTKSFLLHQVELVSTLRAPWALLSVVIA